MVKLRKLWVSLISYDCESKFVDARNVRGRVDRETPERVDRLLRALDVEAELASALGAYFMAEVVLPPVFGSKLDAYDGVDGDLLLEVSALVNYQYQVLQVFIFGQPVLDRYQFLALGSF